MISPFTHRVVEIIKSIPKGKVTTYGIIADYANNRLGARQVARILHSSSQKYHLPWHRVVNKQARISLKAGEGYELQRQLLEQEGVVFDENNRIDFDRFLWWPNQAGVRKTKKEK